MRKQPRDLGNNMIIFRRHIWRIQSITVLVLGAVMLFSCKTDQKEIDRIVSRADRPEMSGENLTLLYSDSARIKYKVITPEYNKYDKEGQKYDEFPKGIHAILYDKEGNEVGSLVSEYAKKLEDEMLWEIRNKVVVVNSEGKKLETELLYWDMKKEFLYTDRYTRFTSDEQLIEGNNGFESDQQLNNPQFKSVTGKIAESENQPK
ncbi:LPS export ABC transporter periplasmic protein LptC [uncultured Sanguibacteroides sp.]|uniref:LPS export ABC transporter periplasmic protein LptC n=1 Tax=uncultured Sanguibacteroides sp. TaxID=1635151 RepID=UPI0025F97591|nr:LPS export ABC transporter periplasmic protein LptC [uncultured Sanguibacteroides sp.]